MLLKATPPVSIVACLLAGGNQQLAAELVGAVRTVDRAVLASRLRMVLGVDTSVDLERFGGRVLYLRAVGDRVVSSVQAAVLRELRPDAVVAAIDGPHLLLQARPEACWAHIASFVESIMTNYRIDFDAGAWPR